MREKRTHLVRYQRGFLKRKKKKEPKDTASSAKKQSQEQEVKTEIINATESSSSFSVSEP